MTQSRRFASLATSVLVLSAMLIATTAQAQTPVDTGLAWLNAHQNLNGTWGATPDLVPRDTARALIAQSLLNRPLTVAPAAFAWLNAQSGFGANQFLAEQALAMSLGKIDDSAVLVRLAQQRSATGADYGGFADNTGDSIDSALALQALATQNSTYTAQISGLVTSLMLRQNPDGGWGIDQGSSSNTVMTGEVLIAFASLKTQQQPPAVVLQIGQHYLAAQIHPDGSIGNGVLETALAFRALALSGYALSSTATATLNYLGAKRAGDGSWGSDAYLTARVLEAYAANKPNLIIGASDVTVNPPSVIDGGNVTVSIKVTNIGALTSPGTSVALRLTDANGRALGSANIGGLSPGASQTATITFAATTMVGKNTLFVLVDPSSTIDELRKDDNSSTALLTVAGKPDLQLYAADITTTPAHVQPNQPATLNFIIRNNGDGDASNAGYSVVDGATQIAKATVASIANGTSQTVSVPLNLAAGSHTLTITADPDGLIAETNETNNSATKTIAVSPLANLDLRIAPGAVTATPAGATAGQSVTLAAIVDNIGNTPAQTSVVFFDGDPSLGRAIAVIPLSLDAQASQQVTATYVVSPTTTVVWAVVDPQNLLAETDETNNAAYVAVTSQFVDVTIQRDGLVLPRTPLSAGQQITARAVVRNIGTLPATNVEVAIYDDLPQLGGRVIVDTFVNVAAGGKVVVPATWNIRAGQRLATAIVNSTKAVQEIDYSNDKVTRLYVVSGNEADIALSTSIPRAQAVDTSGAIVDGNALTISGLAKIDLVGTAPRPFAVTIFDDVDGDLAFNPEVDIVLGTANALAGISDQIVQVPLQGTLRFAPGHPVIYIDSGNAIAETNEANNLIDLWQDCQGTVPPSTGSFYKWRTSLQSSRQAVVARLIDTNGDDFIDDNDVPIVVTTVSGTVVAMRGDTGQVLWTHGTDAAGTNVVPVIADVDGDGKPDIIAHSSDGAGHSLICLNNDGTTKWVSPGLDRDPMWDFVLTLDGTYSYVGMPVVADLDGDGHPEVISGRSVLNGKDGTLKWVGTGGSGRVWDVNDFTSYFSSADLEGPIAADLLGDGKQEVVGGNTAYRPDGSILWSRGDLPDGLTAAVFVPNQTTPNVCLVAGGSIWLLNGTTGATVWGPVGVPNGARFGGAPTVFMDGTTGPWIGVAGEGHYSVLNALTGAVRWSVSTVVAGEQPALTQNAATAFDFGSGQRLCYSGQSSFFIFKASDGSIETRLGLAANGTGTPMHVNLPFPGAPTIADMDGDGHADIYVPDSTTGFGVLSNTTWNSAPAIYNQASYHVVNVANEEAVIPAHETQTTFSRGNWRSQLAQPPGTAGHIPQPNLVASYPRLDASHYPTSARLIVRIGNNGWATADPVSVAFYRVNANNTSTFLGATQSASIPAGGYQDVVYILANPSLGAFSFYAIADRAANGTGTLTECNETDNQSPTFSSQFTADVAIDPTTVVASNTVPMPNTNVDLSASAKLIGTIDASALKAQFFLGSPAGTAISSQLPIILTSNPDGSRTASVTYTWNVNVAVGNYDIYVVFDPANVIAETDETNNTGHFAIAVSQTQNADVATDNSLFIVSDPNPRPGDTIQLGTTAHLSGTFDTTQLAVQFFNGDPASGGTAISPVIPATVKTVNTFSSASVVYNWNVNLAEGTYRLYAVWDPANAIQEINEANNVASASVQVSTPQLVRKLSAVVTLNPPSSEAGQPVGIAALVQNLGNATLDTATINYVVTGGNGSGMTGSATITSLPKNQFVSLNLGSFTPQTNGTYTVTLSTPDSTLTLVVGPKTITIAPFATAQLHVAPASVPVSLPLIQMHTNISRTNTIVVPDDPLVPLIKTHLQNAVNWQEQAMPAELNAGCYRCHVHAQGLVGFAAASQVSGVTVDQTLAAKTFNYILSFQNSDGSWFSPGYQVTAGSSATWAIALGGDPTQGKTALVNGLNWLLPRMSNGPNGSGFYTCDDCRISFDGTETPTMLSMIAFTHGWEQTRDPNYLTAMTRLTNWALQYNYQATAQSGPELAARIAIGLSAVIPDLPDPALQTAAKKRVQDIALFLRSQQNPDGSFGAMAAPDYPVLRTAQSLYVLALSGAPGSDPALRNAILWLINHQLPAGGWSEWQSEFTQPVHWWDETTWSMIALPAAFLRLGQFDVDYSVVLPSTSDLASSSPPPATINLVNAGKQLVWHFPNVTESGQDVSFNVRLNGLQPNESRPATGAESITFTHPYTGATETQNLGVPPVTGFAPLSLALSTDKPSYGPNTPVTIAETVGNVGTTNDGITTDVAIRDANGLTVATLATGAPVNGLPPNPFPGWHYAVPVSSNITTAGTSRALFFPLDFGAQLAALGVTGTFDTNSIRVSSDDASSTELAYTWLPGAVSTAGQIIVRIPDSIAAGTAFNGHVFFDVIDNGFKPASLFQSLTGNTSLGLNGIKATYGYLDTARMSSAPSTPDGIVYLGPPVMSIVQPTTQISAPAPPRPEFWGTEWTGELFVPSTGTYQFLLGSDDGSWFYIDNQLVLAEPGNHGTFNVTTSITLTAGFHSLRGEMFNWGGPYNFYVQWAPPGQGFTAIPTSSLYQQAPASSGVTLGTPAVLANGSVTLTDSWNTGVTAAAPYTAVATLRQYGAFITTTSTPFTILPSTQITATVVTDKPAYDPNNTVHLTGSVSESFGNTNAIGLSATISVLDPSGSVVAKSATPAAIPSLVPGQNVAVNFDWAVGSAAPGAYTAKISVVDSSGTVLAQGSAPFTVRSTANNGKGITGTIAAPDPVYQGQTVSISAGINNGGNAALTDAPFAVQIIDPQSQSLVATLNFTASPAAGQPVSVPVPWAVGAANPQIYTATLVSLITGQPVPLASASFTVKIATAIVTATIGSDKPAYDVNDTLHATTNVTLQSAPLPLVNVTVVATISDSSSAVVTTNTQSIATIAPGQTLPVSFDWNAGTTAPGTYTLAAIVGDGSGTTYAQPSTTFVIRPTSVTGIGVTGTISTPASVTQRDPLPITATVTDSGNTALSNAPFTVTISSDTLPFTASMAMGATVTQQLTEQTAALSPGNYTATLISMITGSPVTLASANFVVKEIPTIVTDAVAIDKSGYDPGDTLHETTTVTCSSAPATLTNLSVVVTITDPLGNAVATSTSAIASLAVGASTATTFDWPITTVVPPGTYTLTAVVKSSSGAQLATGSKTFVVRSTAVSGIGVSGTLTAAASVIQGDPLPLTATIADTGNVALTNAPFAVNVSSDTLSFTLSVPLGGSATKQLTENTLPLAPGNYTATLVSMITGSPVMLASASFIVKEIPTIVTDAVTIDKSVYDPGDTLHETTTVTCSSAPATLTNLSVVVTITDASGNAVATSTSAIASLAVGSSATTTFDWPVTSAVPPGTYTLTGVVKSSSGAQLAQNAKTFVIVKPAMTLTLTPSSTARVLIWANCSAGNSGATCTPAAPPFLTTTLTNAGIPWTLAGDENTFIALLRTGGYTEAILDPPPTAEPKIASELSEAIHAGIGVLLIKDHPDAMPKLAAAFGVSYNGNLNATSTLLDILATPVAPHGQMTANGNSVRLDLGTAKAAALISATQLPAISYNTFGGGRVIVLPFDAEKTPTADMASFLLAAVSYVSRASGTDARSVIALDFAVTAPPGGSQNVTVNVALPQAVTVVSASPALTVSNPPSWSVTVPGGTTMHLALRVRLPETIGSYDVTGTLVLAGQTIVTRTATLSVTADRAAIESALASDLSTLLAKAPASDQHAINDAQSQLAAIQAASPADSAAVVALINRVMTIIDDLQHVSIDTTAVRAGADRMLIYWQSRAGS